MAVTNFIRTIWDAELKQALSKKLVSQYFVNHNYEGAIMGAGSVKINQLADVTLRDYDGNDITTEDIATTAFAEIFEDMPAWRKKMIHYIKEENPEVNTAIIEAANKTSLDPKAVALGAYMVYLLIEMAANDSDAIMKYTE